MSEPKRATTGRIAALVTTAALVAGCGGAGSSNPPGRTGGAPAAGAVGDVLNIAYPAPPNSLDPAKTQQQYEWYVNLAYDPLIAWGPAGRAQPGLATSWHYVGKGNRAFELTLRRGAHFSDGSPVTAQAVKQSLDYQKRPGGVVQAFWADKTIAATGPRTVRITAKSPDPQLVRELSQDYLAGNIISPKAIANPKQLGTTTAGAGPYMLDPAHTVANDHYTYVPNPHYWNKPAVHYRKVVIKVIANSNSILNALKTGQVDVATGDYTTVSAAQSAGLRVTSAPLVWVGLGLFDRAGKMVPALGDVRVRQALNYAVDRATITRGLFSRYGTPTEQTVVPGQDGSLDRPVYRYDPAKARQLLAQAGYRHGFDLPVLSSNFGNQGQVIQAVAADLQKVGVRVKLTTQANTAKYFTDMAEGRYPAAGFGFGGLPIYLEGPSLFLPGAAQFNPLKSASPTLERLYAKAAAAGGTQRAALDQQVERWLVQNAWFVPVTVTPMLYYARSNVAGVRASGGQPWADPVWFGPASS